MRQCWDPVVLIDVYMFGISAKLVRSRLLRMLRMAHLSFFSFMEATLLKFLISLGILLIHGLFAVLAKTTLCKFGKWLKIFTTTMKEILLQLKWKSELSSGPPDPPS